MSKVRFNRLARVYMSFFCSFFVFFFSILSFKIELVENWASYLFVFYGVVPISLLGLRVW